MAQRTLPPLVREETLPQRLRRWRLEREPRMSVAELVAQMNQRLPVEYRRKRSWLQAVESGRFDPSDVHLVALADVLGKSPSELGVDYAQSDDIRLLRSLLTPLIGAEGGLTQRSSCNPMFDLAAA